MNERIALVVGLLRAMNRKAATWSTPWPRKRTKVRVAGVRTAPDLVDRDFGPDAPARIARGRSPTRIMGEIGSWGEKYLQIDGFECGGQHLFRDGYTVRFAGFRQGDGSLPKPAGGQ
jgi:hypothetical protein